MKRYSRHGVHSLEFSQSSKQPASQLIIQSVLHHMFVKHVYQMSVIVLSLISPMQHHTNQSIESHNQRIHQIRFKSLSRFVLTHSKVAEANEKEKIPSNGITETFLRVLAKREKKNFQRITIKNGKKNNNNMAIHKICSIYVEKK